MKPVLGRVGRQDRAIQPVQAGADNVRTLPQGAERLGGHIGIIECQRRGAVVGDDPGQRRKVAAEIAAKQNGVGDHDAHARADESGGGRDHDDDRELLPDRDVAEAAHLYAGVKAALLALIWRRGAGGRSA